MEYFAHVLVLLCIYAILASSLNFSAGEGGMVSAAQGAFYGVGAYATALGTVVCHQPSWLSACIGILVGGLLSASLARLTSRLNRDRFTVATFGFQVVVYSVMNNWVDVTRGAMGIAGIPAIRLWGQPLDAPQRFVWPALTACIIVHVSLVSIARGPFGKALHAVREDELLAAALGKQVTAIKTWAAALSGASAAIAGSLYAHYISYVDPSAFTLTESVLIVSILIIGGMGSARGSLVGAAFFVLVSETLRFSGFPSSTAANLRQLTLGVLLVLALMFRPRGLVGSSGVGL